MADPADIRRLHDGWLGRQPAAFQSALIGAASWRHVDADATFNHAGDEIGGIWGIARGQVDGISALGAADSPILDIYIPGLWGGLAPVLGYTRVANCTARLPTLLALVSQPRLRALLREHPEWWECVAQLAMDFAIRYGSATGDLLIRSSRQRVIAVLLRLANCRHRDPATLPTIILSHGDLAAAANMSRHLAGETLRVLEDGRLIDLGYRQVTIRDAAALRRIVDG